MHNINHNNFSFPFYLSYKRFKLPISTTIFKRYFIKVKNALYQTDVGLVFEDIKNESGFIHGDQEVSVDLKVGAFRNPSAFAQLSLQSDPISVHYKRSYGKLQNVIANAGGAFSACFTLGTFLMYFLTKKDYFLNLISQCYELEESDCQFQLNNNNSGIVLNYENKLSKLTIQKAVIKKKPCIFKLSASEKFFPSEICCYRENVKKYVEAEEKIANQLSYSNLLNNIIKVESLIEILLSEDQFKILNKQQKLTINNNIDNKFREILHLNQISNKPVTEIGSEYKSNQVIISN